MRNLRLAVLVGTLAVFLAAGTAFAQGMGAGQGCQERFKALDTNHDGKVTREEFMAAPHNMNHAEQMFNSMDVNGRGYLSEDDFCSGRGMGQGMGRGMGRGMGGGQGRGMNQ